VYAHPAFKLENVTTPLLDVVPVVEVVVHDPVPAIDTVAPLMLVSEDPL